MKQLAKQLGLHYAYNFDEYQLIVAIGPHKVISTSQFIWWYRVRGIT